jgi:hypothetical protein
MGQQQLILLVLATVIVGIAIVVGIAAFTENSARANADAMMQDAVRIANDLQAWKKKPAAFGGQAAYATPGEVGDPTDFTGATFEILGYSTAGVGTLDATGEYSNFNGTFTLTPGTNPIIEGTNTVEGNSVAVIVCGMGAGDVRGLIMTLANNDVSAGLPTCGTEEG